MNLPASPSHPSPSSYCQILSPSSQVFTNVHTLAQWSAWSRYGSIFRVVRVQAELALTGQYSGSQVLRCVYQPPSKRLGFILKLRHAVLA